MERRNFLKRMAVVIGGILSPELKFMQKRADEIGTVEFNKESSRIYSLYESYGAPSYYADSEGIVRKHINKKLK